MLAAVDTKFLYKKIEHMTRVSALYNLKPYTYTKLCCNSLNRSFKLIVKECCMVKM